jgi:hypothetical protein
MIRSIALAAVLAVGSSPLPLDVPVDAYRAAASGAPAPVAGRAYEEPRRRGAPEVPLANVAITLLPRSSAFLARLEEIRRHARDDARAYRASARALRSARRELERALSDAGAGDLVRFTTSGPDGAFDLGAVPAGAWVLIAERAVFVDKPGVQVKRRQPDPFLPTPRFKGYHVVTVWVRELPLTAGQGVFVELNDRNGWMTAIEEEREPGAGG